MVPFGAIIAACSTIRKNSESYNEKRPFTRKPKSSISLVIDDKTVEMNFKVSNDFDWARAAWALIKACEKKGQGENLKKILSDCDYEVISGSLESSE